MKWYYAVGDQPLGPVTRAELESLYDGGKISTSTLVTQEGMYEWVPYVDLKKTTQFLPAIRSKVPKEMPEAEPGVAAAPEKRVGAA